MSHFSEKGSLRISSGAIHSGVPADEESLIVGSVIILDSPKSQILTVQCLFTRQFALFMSRCTIFIRCMHISPLQKTDVNYYYFKYSFAWNKNPHLCPVILPDRMGYCAQQSSAITQLIRILIYVLLSCSKEREQLVGISLSFSHCHLQGIIPTSFSILCLELLYGLSLYCINIIFNQLPPKHNATLSVYLCPCTV